MSEDFLHFIWKFRLFDKNIPAADTGESVTVIHPGIHNFDSGPDFYDAKVKIGDITWAGNVEIHKKSSDWNAHGHNNNSAYSNVILHVVVENNVKTYNAAGDIVPTVIINYPEFLELKYIELKTSVNEIPCSSGIKHIDDFKLKSWLFRMATERLEARIQDINKLSLSTVSDWEYVFMQRLFKSFGFKINTVPFEMLHQSLPRIRNLETVSQIEALLLGQAGFLENSFEDDEYYLNLRKEYRHMVAKYSLKPLDADIWKFARTRPTNFPTIRLAQLAGLLHKYPDLFDLVTETSDIKRFFNLFEIEASEYWNNHYVIGKTTDKVSPKRIGQSSIESILINVVIPILFAFGRFKGDEKLVERALELQEILKPENNTIISTWGDSGVIARNALESQALLHLKSEYCDKKKCLHCSIGKSVIEMNL